MSFKIFGIGLPKTGTWSLCLSMNFLGLNTLHYIEPNTLEFYINLIETKDFVNDCPINYIFDILPNKFPNSKFICTTRAFDSWISSSKFFFKKEKIKEFQKEHLEKIFNATYFDETRFKKAYNLHMEKVIDFSKNNQVLILPLEKKSDEKWNLICNFLKFKIPNKQYPWINRRKTYLL